MPLINAILLIAVIPAGLGFVVCLFLRQRFRIRPITLMRIFALVMAMMGYLDIRLAEAVGGKINRPQATSTQPQTTG